MGKDKPPPLMLVLLWQHFCYYKRHKVLLAISVLLPLVLSGLLAAFLYLFASGGLASPTCYPETRQQTVSLLSSGVLQYVQGSYSCYQRESIKLTAPDGYDLPSSDKNWHAYPKYYFDSSVLHYELAANESSPTCSNHQSVLLEELDCKFLLNYNNMSFYNYDPTSSLLEAVIVYYPNTSNIARETMSLVTKRLETYALFNGTNSWNIGEVSAIFGSMDMFSLLSNCFVDPKKRVLGFANRDDMLSFTQNNLTVKNLSSVRDPIPLLWGAVSFENTESEFNNHRFSYNILYESGYNRVDKKDIWLQDLVEEAALKVVANRTNQSDLVQISATIKELPSKCWYKPPSFIYNMLQTWLPLVVTIGFFLMPTTFLILIVQEKMLKLREYLFIMGVSDLYLKMSWIVFFLLFLIPMAIITVIIITFLPGGVFSDTDPSIILVLIVLYTLSQLCWVYLLSTVMQTPARAGFIVGFFNIFFSTFIFSSYIFSQGKLTGSYLIIARIISLHTSVPFSLSMCYVVGWEAIWTGSQWGFFFDAPTVGDGYHGFGECILWMIGDSFLYLFLAWYFQHLFPGEFGIKYPFYFLFQPSFWLPSKYGQTIAVKETEESKADIELFALNNEAGVRLESLTKYYSNDKIGIDKLSVMFYKNQVTAFLGENGAGKTTTMNIIVGLIHATDGKAYVNGYNVSTHLSAVRKQIAFVPQYDILYPSMTVQEHIKFFGWLQNMSSEQIESSMKTLLEWFDLTAQKNSVTTNLSGGQKRKLSILTAYIGNPSVIILDEPTSGVDPYSRKAIWDMIAKRRANATTLLSTHYMEEADILGDRIAIINGGKLQCAGSSMYLKNKYGRGYHLTLAVESNGCGDAVDKFLFDKVQQIKFVQESGNDRTYSIPMEVAQSEQMVQLLETLEEKQSAIGVTSFGVAEPSMEEVFFAATGARHQEMMDVNLDSNGSDITRNAQEMLHERATIFSQFITLLKRRIRLTFRSISVLVLQILLPLILVCVLLLIDGGFTSNSSGQNVVNYYAPFRQNVFFFQDHGGMGEEFLNVAEMYGLDPQSSTKSGNSFLNYSNVRYLVNGTCSCESYCSSQQSLSYPSTTVTSGDLVYPLDSSVNATDWILHANQSNHWVVGGFEFFKLPPTVFDLNDNLTQQYNLTMDALNETTVLDYAVIWTTPDLNMAMLNSFNNLRMKRLDSQWSLILNREAADLVPIADNIIAQVTSIITSIISCYFLIMAYVFATFGIANVVQMERNKGLKRLLYITGANPVVYWCTNMLWDIIQFAFTVALTFILLGLISNPFKGELPLLTLVLLPFGFSTMAFTYLLSFVIDTPQALNRTISLVGFIALIVAAPFAMLSVFDSGDLDNGDYWWVIYVSSIFCLFPYYFVSESITYIAFAKTLSNQLPGDNVYTNMLDFDQVGRRIMEGWISAVVLFSIVILVEYTSFGWFSRRKCCLPEESNVQATERIVDIDVANEEARVLSNVALNDPLVVRNVTKMYPKQLMPAVNGVSFSIPRGQCFGLLGINGAGKTSLFRILAGFNAPSSGTATIEGFDIQEDWNNVGQKMSYCPQENILFDQLTPKEHLKMVAELRGIPSEKIEQEIDRLIAQVGLEKQVNKYTGQLSGGNQRKVQFAMALMDYRPIIFLDEPTTGMDPSARRMAWNSIIDAVSRGCSIVLTSHSMEECEMLCHRLVIMVLGNFSCIGSVQYLKNKFGNRYTFKVKLTPTHDPQKVHELKTYFHQHFSSVVLIEEHATLLVFELNAESLRISSLFKMLSNCKKEFTGLVEDFATSQVSLEHVFVNMAERQQMIATGTEIQIMTGNP